MMADDIYEDLAKNYEAAKQPKAAPAALPALPSLGANNPYDHFIVDSATKYGIDPNLIRAQMGQESSYKPNAISNKGARGLMQLEPATAIRFGVKNIYDPQQNIEGGV